jgi:biopolymer transport protein ExbB/TolQ
MMILLNPWVSAIIVTIIGAAASIYVLSFSSLRQSPRFTGFLPQLWTGLGILGTFISLFVRLGILGVDPNDIGKLIKELSSAFSTSVAGLMGSIIVSVIIRYSQYWDDQNIQQKEWAKQSPEELLYRLMQSSQDTEKHLKFAWEEEKRLLMERQKATEQLLETLKKDIKEMLKNQHERSENLQAEGLMEQKVMFKQWGDKLDNMTSSMSASFQKLLDNLKDTLEQRLDSLSQDTTQKWQTSINTILENFSSEGQKLLAENTETKKQLLENQQQLAQSMSGTFEELQQSLAAHITDSKNIITKSSQELAGRLNESLEQMIKVHADTVEDAFERMKEWQQTSKLALEQTTNSFREAVNQYQDFKNEEEAVLQQIRKQLAIWEQLLSNQSALLTTVEQHHEKIDSISAMMEDTAQAVSKLSEIKRYLAELSSNGKK